MVSAVLFVVVEIYGSVISLKQLSPTEVVVFPSLGGRVKIMRLWPGYHPVIFYSHSFPSLLTRYLKSRVGRKYINRTS